MSLTEKKWQNSVKNVRAYISFKSVKSDPKIVSCRYQISYRQSKASSPYPMKNIDWKKVIADASLCGENAVAVHNRFSALADELEEIPDISTNCDPRQTKKSPWSSYRKG